MKTYKHSLSNYRLQDMPGGRVVPIGIQEVLPGDTFQQATTALIRLDPMLAPVMHPLHATIHHWFVPNRLCWDSWEDFITGNDPDAEFPYIDMDNSGGQIGSNWDFFGMAPMEPTADNVKVNAIPFRALQLIWNEWYRDQDLQDELIVPTTDGEDSVSKLVANAVPLPACWSKDYFTSARPWAQKGSEIAVPLSGSAPVTGLGKYNQNFADGSQQVYQTDGTGQDTYTDSTIMLGGLPGDTTFLAEEDPNNPGFPNFRVNMENGTVSLEDLRLGFALKRYEEARAMYGSRYTEYLRYLGVRSSDARLQRPEYLGGGKQTVQFSEILQTAEGTDPVGSLKGHGISATRSNRYRRFFEEHGYVISVMIIRPIPIYSQGLPRMWNKFTKEDFWQKELEHIGQQEIAVKEVYVGTEAQDRDDVFGYQPRYEEYRRGLSTVCGNYRNSTLNYWHMARDFSSKPVLNSDFVQCSPTDRIFAAPESGYNYKCMIHHSIQARRLVTNNIQNYVY